jgi:hypothetical protein
MPNYPVDHRRNITCTRACHSRRSLRPGRTVGGVGGACVGYGRTMTHSTPFVPPDERAHSVGATGGLPGANADPRTAEVAPEEIESTVAAADAPGDAAPDPADELADRDPS